MLQLRKFQFSKFLQNSKNLRFVTSYRNIQAKLNSKEHEKEKEFNKTNSISGSSGTMATGGTPLMSDVHGTTHGKSWRNRPLFHRLGDKRFRNGMEAAEMLYEEAVRRDPYQTEFLQAVQMFVDTLCPVFDRYPKYAWVMKQLLEPERLIQFRVPWVDDTGNYRVNRGYRIQYSSSLGPYLGTLRFHPDCNYSTVKFLGFENVFRNALIGNAGGAAGGSDFNPITKSEAEIMRFCQSFMTELANYIGPYTDTPGPGIGVGIKEIGYLFGQYKRLKQEHHWDDINGVLSGSRMWYPSITGSGIAYFTERTLKDKGASLKGRTCLFSGSGNVALHTASKVLELGGIPLGFSDTSGIIIEPNGFTKEKLKILKEIKSRRFSRIGNYLVESTSAEYIPYSTEGPSIWEAGIACDYAFPSSIENDLTLEKVTKLIDNGCQGVFEGAHMPCTNDAVRYIREKGLIYVPAKAMNGALLAFNHVNMHYLYDKEMIDKMIQKHVERIYNTIQETAKEYSYPNDYMMGTNIASFLNVAKAMIEQGAV